MAQFCGDYSGRLPQARVQADRQHRWVAIKVIRYFVWTANRTRRTLFLRTVREAMRSQPSEGFCSPASVACSV